MKKKKHYNKGRKETTPFMQILRVCRKGAIAM